MNPRSARSGATKEVIHIRRDVRSLIIVVIMPDVLVLLFGYGVSLDLKHLPDLRLTIAKEASRARSF